MANEQGTDQNPVAGGEAEIAPGLSVPSGLTSGGIVQPPQDTGGTGTPGLPGMPGAGIDLLSAQFLKHWLERTPQPGPSAPGSFGDKLRSAVGQIGAGLGDAAGAAQNLEPGEGPIGGVTRTLAARTKRMAGEREEAMKAAEFRQRSAMNNIQMAVHVTQLQKENALMQNTVFDSNKAASKAREDSGWDVEHGVSEQEARKRISTYKDDQGRHYTDLYEFIPVGYTEINGKKIPQYDVVSKQERTVKPTDDEIKFITANGGPKLTAGTEVPNTSLTAMRLAAQRTATARQGIEDSLNRKLSSDQMNAVKEALATKEIHDAMASDPADKINGLIQSSKMLDEGIKQHQTLLANAQKTGDQQAIQEAQMWLDEHKRVRDNLQTVLSYGISKDEYTAHEKQAQEREKERHDERIEELKERQLDISEKKSTQITGQESDPEAEGLARDYYLQFLKKKRPDDYYTVNNILQGKGTLPTRFSKDGLRVINMVNRSSGTDWDPALGKEWPKARNEYFGSGQSAKNVISYNTVLRHLAAYYNRTQGAEAFVPLTQAYNDRQAEQAFIKEELAKAVSAGVMTEHDKDEFETKLFPTYQTPAMKRERVKEGVRDLGARIESMERALDKAKPSKTIKTSPLMDDVSQRAADYVLTDGKSGYPKEVEASPRGQAEAGGQQPAQGAPVQTPAGQKVSFKAPDGQTYYFDTQAQLDNFKKLAKIQ